MNFRGSYLQLDKAGKILYQIGLPINVSHDPDSGLYKLDYFSLNMILISSLLLLPIIIPSPSMNIINLLLLSNLNFLLLLWMTISVSVLLPLKIAPYT